MLNQAFLQFDVRSSAAGALRPRMVWQPAADVYRCPGGWLIKVELAGVGADDVDVYADGQRITVRGTRRDVRFLEQQEAHRLEIAYSRFERLIELPASLEAAEVRRAYRDGMLYILVLTHDQNQQMAHHELQTGAESENLDHTA